MKCFAIVLVVAAASVALAVANPVDVESIEPVDTKATESVEPVAAAADGTNVRDKRTLLLGAAAYATPVAYSAYAAPLAYSAYSAPTYPVAYSTAYTAYNPYPYYASPYYVV